MSFKVFIYYCALCGAWAAFLAWGASALFGLGEKEAIVRSAGLGALLGFFIAAAIGFTDAVLNAVGVQRLVRVLICAVLGLIGGTIGGGVGGFIVAKSGISYLALPGWMLVGTLVGGSIGVFDVVRAFAAGEDPKASIKKVINGVLGGVLGGLIGGLPFTVILSVQALIEKIPNGGLAFSLVLLGGCVGLMIGLAQVFLKQAWIKVEEGFRPGRELMLTKDETTIGRAEGCDLGLFGDNTIEKAHAKVVLKNKRYLIEHVAEGGETLLNDQPVSKPTPLKAGDLIRVGRSVLRFGEKEKRRG